MIKINLKKAITAAVIMLVIAISLFGCGPEKTPLAGSNKPALSPTAAVELSPGPGTDATSGATVAPAQAPNPIVDATSSATVTVTAGNTVDAVSSATVKGGADEEDDEDDD